MFWLNKLEELVLGGTINPFFQNMSRKEAVIVAVKNIWEEKFNRKDLVNFENNAFIIDPHGKEEEQPPHIITRQMGLDDIEMRKTGLTNFKKLIE